MSQSLLRAVHDRLRDCVLDTALQGRLYHVAAPANAARPYLVFHVAEQPPPPSLTPPGGLWATVHISLFGEPDAGPDVLTGLNDLLFHRLQQQPLSVPGFAGGQTWCLDRAEQLAHRDLLEARSRYQVSAGRQPVEELAAGALEDTPDGLRTARRFSVWAGSPLAARRLLRQIGVQRGSV